MRHAGILAFVFKTAYRKAAVNLYLIATVRSSELAIPAAASIVSEKPFPGASIIRSDKNKRADSRKIKPVCGIY